MLLESRSGVDDGARTHDDRNHNPGLYQLSYVHHCKNDCPAIRQMARPAGLEPATLGLEGRCSIQMSYGRITPGPGYYHKPSLAVPDTEHTGPDIQKIWSG